MSETTTTAPPSAQAQLDADVDAHADAALPPGVFPLGEHTFRIAPMKTRQVFPFLKLARPVFAALAKLPSSPPAALPPSSAGGSQGSDLPPAAVGLTGAALESAMDDAEVILDLLEQHGPSAIKALAVGITSDPSDTAALKAAEDAIGDLEAVHLVTLLKHFVQVNASFFVAQGLSLPPGLVLPRAAAAVAAAAPSGP